jgi:hypothetical protein
MSDNNTLYIVGGVVAVAALGAFVLSKSDRRPPALGTAASTTGQSTTGPSTGGPVIGNTTGTGAAGASLGQTQNMQADLEAQRLAQLALQEKTANVRRFWGIATDAENRQMTVRVSIDGVSRNRAAYSGFYNEFVSTNTQGNSWNDRVNSCIESQKQGCGFDLFGSCTTPSFAFCRDQSPTISANGSRNPAQQIRDAAPAYAEQKLAEAQAFERQGFQAELARLEAQYNGAVQALSALGVQFKSNSPSPL